MPGAAHRRRKRKEAARNERRLTDADTNVHTDIPLPEQVEFKPTCSNLVKSNATINHSLEDDPEVLEPKTPPKIVRETNICAPITAALRLKENPNSTNKLFTNETTAPIVVTTTSEPTGDPIVGLKDLSLTTDEPSVTHTAPPTTVGASSDGIATETADITVPTEISSELFSIKIMTPKKADSTTNILDPAAVAEKKSMQELVPAKNHPQVNVIPVSQSIYGTSKGVWKFGTHVPLLNLWIGATHCICNKTVNLVAGQDLESLDHGIETKLAELDYHLSRLVGR